MKSKLISATLSLPDSSELKAFVRDLDDVLKLTEEERQACLTVLPSVHLAQSKGERLRVVDQFVDDHQMDRDELGNAIGVMRFFLNAFLDRDIPDSDWEFWASDLEEAKYLDGSTRPVFEALVANIKSELVTEVEPESRRRRAARGVLPVFKGCGVTVEVRSVREDFYRRGTPIEQFEPKVVDTTTVASVSITVDAGPFKDMYFQADESDIDYLVSMFQAAKKEMAALRGFLKLEA